MTSLHVLLQSHSLSQSALFSNNSFRVANELNGQAIAMIIYFVAMIIIGVYGYTRTKTMDDYMVGGRSLPPMVAALSAGASDMSGWLLLGLPGALYLNGIVDAWIAVGLTIGAWANWKWVAPRLRTYSQVAEDSITVPSFISARLKDERRIIQLVAGFIILVFFTFYVSSGMVSGGTFFEATFGWDYRVGMVLVAGIVILYTLIGGFLAVSWTDTVQGIMMLIALVLVPTVGLWVLGGFGVMSATLNGIDASLFNPLGKGLDFAGWIGLISALAWGLGYFGQPHIIVRFMALRSPKEATRARNIGIGWMILCVAGAGLTALAGRAMSAKNMIPDLTTGEGNPQETVFLVMGQNLFPALLAGFMLAAILAAVMSTVSSQLLVTSSAVVEDMYRGVTKKRLTGYSGMTAGRIVVLGVSVLAAILAWFRTDSILSLVAFAWAGFGGAFGPIIILCLYWRKVTTQGALAGMIGGAVTVGVWGNLPKENLPAIFSLYEILPGFLVCLLLTWVVSRATYKHNPVIEAEFDEAIRLLDASTEELEAWSNDPQHPHTEVDKLYYASVPHDKKE